MLKQMATVLLDLYRGCRKQDVQAYPQWAMTLIQQVIPHDKWYWGISTRPHGEIPVHVFHGHHILLEAMPKWAQYKHLDTFTESYITVSNVVHNVTYEMLKPTRIYELFYRELNIAQMLGIHAYKPSPDLYDLILFTRSDPETPFSEEERQVMECMVPHLIEARNINYLERLSGCRPHAQQHCMAVADNKGVIHIAEEGFVELMKTEWPQWQCPRLPELLVNNLGVAGYHYDGRMVILRIAPLSGMFQIDVRPRTRCDSLTRREQEIAHHFANGLSNKEIAREMGLSYTSVRNSLSFIYHKLDVSNKGELATLLSIYPMD